MIKNVFLFSTVSIFIFLLNSFTYASDLKLIINDFKCEYDELFIHYSVINYISYERKNVSAVFKITKEGIPIACDEQILTIPKNADGSEIHEVIINVQCKGGSISIEADAFHEEIESSKREAIEKFLSGCP